MQKTKDTSPSLGSCAGHLVTSLPMRHLLRWVFRHRAVALAILVFPTGAAWMWCACRESALPASFKLGPVRSSVVATTQGVSFTLCWPSYRKTIASTPLYVEGTTDESCWSCNQLEDIDILDSDELSIGPWVQWIGDVKVERGFLGKIGHDASALHASFPEGEIGGFCGPVTKAWRAVEFPYPYLMIAMGTPLIVRRLAAAWHRRRQASGACAACGYDLRATPGRCPECGAVPESPHKKSPTSGRGQ